MTTEKRKWVIGTRKSQLALAQAQFVQDLLAKKFPECSFELLAMSTTGDKVLDVALNKIGEKALFTKELEVALENKQCDFVVHSLKDLPTRLPKGMTISSILEREQPNDALVVSAKHRNKGWTTLDSLPPDAVIGTSSVRRKAQLLKQFPKLRFSDIRGNLNTRLNKLDSEDLPYDALVLACAGLIRLGLSDRITQVLPPTVMLHAVGQGALAIECCEDDECAIQITQSLSCKVTTTQCLAERAFMRRLEGGCSKPLGVWSTYSGSTLFLEGIVCSLDGKESVTACGKVETACDSAQTAEELGNELAEELILKGAEKLMQSI